MDIALLQDGPLVRQAGQAARLALCVALLAAGLWVATPARAQNAARGMTLYFNTNGAPVSCGTVSCHDGFPGVRRNKIASGGDPAVILSAIRGNKGGMGILGPYVSTTDAADIAAYIVNPAAATSPVAEPSTSALSFPATAIGATSASSTLTLRNTGGGSLALNTIALAGTSPADFRIAAGGSCAAGGTVAPAGSCTINVAFAPATGGARTATLSITHNAGPATNVGLSGTAAAAAPTIALSASSLVFPGTPVGASNTLPAVLLTNSGSAALNITGLTLGGTNAGDFARAGTCAVGGSVAPGANCTIALSFAPMAIGARSASLAIASNNSGGPVTLALSGNGVANTPMAQLSAASLMFGAQQVGTTSGVRSVTLTNAGGGQLAVTAVSAPAPFAASGNCSGASLGNNQSCTVSVSFAPAAAGATSGNLSITHSASDTPASVTLSGTGSATPVPAVALSRASVAFGGVTAVGQSSIAERVSFTNNGPGSVTLSSVNASSEFALQTAAGNCAAGMTVAQGASCAIDLRFSPSAAGSRSGTLTVMSSGAPFDAGAALSGTGSSVAAPQLAPAPMQVNFGRLMPGANPAMQTVMLANNGSTNLVVNAMSTASPFMVGSGGNCGAPPFSLAPGASCSVQVGFTPGAAGAASGALQITSNGAPASVQLAGEVNSASAGGGAATNAGFGGGSLDPRVLAVLALLTLAAGALRRRAAARASRVTSPRSSFH